MIDFATRRKIMVDSQVRPSDVTHYPIIAAMLEVPRERFVPQSLAEVAYAEENLTLAPGRVLLDPRTFAKMLDALNPGPQDLVLDLAPGTGYFTAVLSRMAQAVVAVEPDPALAAEAEATLAELGCGNVIVENRPAEAGAPAHGPYDALIIEGGIEVFPEALVEQLREGGRAVAIFMEGPLGLVKLGVKRQSALRWLALFNAFAPVLPGFVRPRAFAL